MLIDDLKQSPQRVWINSPSITQPYHKVHGKVGIAVLDKNGQTVTVYFTTGSTLSMVINPLYLDIKRNG